MKSIGYSRHTHRRPAGSLAGVPSPPFQPLKSNWRQVLRQILADYAAEHREFIHGGRPSLQKFSLLVGHNPTLIWEWLGKKPPKEPQFASIAKLMNKLDRPVAVLLDDSHNVTPPLAAHTAELIGIVEGGVWREPQMLDLDIEIRIPCVPDVKFERLRQFAWRVNGHSINRIASDGSYLITVLFSDLHRGPHEGDLVICERHRHGEVEYTAKRVRIQGSEIHLAPDSTDPRFQDAVWKSVDERGADTIVKTEHLVIGTYRPIT